MSEEIKRKSYGKTNKRKGSDAERYYAKIFRDDLGFTHCKTSRLGSKLHDDAGIDLIFLPLNVQIKAGKQVGLNPGKELNYMQGRMTELFPQAMPERPAAEKTVSTCSAACARASRFPTVKDTSFAVRFMRRRTV